MAECPIINHLDGFLIQQVFIGSNLGIDGIKVSACAVSGDGKDASVSSTPRLTVANPEHSLNVGEPYEFQSCATR